MADVQVCGVEAKLAPLASRSSNDVETYEDLLRQYFCKMWNNKVEYFGIFPLGWLREN